MLFGLVVRGLHLLLRQARGGLMSEEHPLLLQAFGWARLLGRQHDGLLPEVGTVRELGPRLGVCRHQTQGLGSRYTRRFSITGGLRP